MQQPQEPQQQTEKLEQWALVELFGHQKIVGRVTETSIGGGAFIRVDVPGINGEKEYTRFFSPGAVYSISPVTEEVARGLLTQSQFRNAPVKTYDLPMLPERTHEDGGDEE